MRIPIKNLFIVCCIFIISGGNVYAETIILKDGKIVNGEIINKTDDYIEVNVGLDFSITYYRDEIEKIESGRRDGFRLYENNQREIAAVTFPKDLFPHPNSRDDYFYYSGILDAVTGEKYGVLLFFYLRNGYCVTAVFTIYDLQHGYFDFKQVNAFQKVDSSKQGYTISINSWLADGPFEKHHLVAETDNFKINLFAESNGPKAIYGEQGHVFLGPKGDSLCYAIPRMPVNGTLTIISDEEDIKPEEVNVSGVFWHEHRWEHINSGKTGWNWIHLYLPGNYALTIFQIFDDQGQIAKDVKLGGYLIMPDGSVITLSPKDIVFKGDSQWVSPKSNNGYPMHWRIQIDEIDCLFEVIPVIKDCELVPNFYYWEGPIVTQGVFKGKEFKTYGFMEMLGKR